MYFINSNSISFEHKQIMHICSAKKKNCIPFSKNYISFIDVGLVTINDILKLQFIDSAKSKCSLQKWMEPGGNTS